MSLKEIESWMSGDGERINNFLVYFLLNNLNFSQNIGEEIAKIIGNKRGGEFFGEIKKMPSFDTVCEPNMVEVRNAVDTCAKEIGTRFDFKGTSANIELKDKEITMFGDAEFQLTQVEDILRNKLTKRNVDVRFLDIGKVEKIGGDKVKQVSKVRNGIEIEQSKKIQQIIKGSKIKVQAAIQGDAVRVTGAKRDDLQAAMALIKSEISEFPLSFNNFRD
jgi:uncharacterized protein YajQ (UPF0234 family)